MVSELSPATTSADKGDKQLELPYGTEVFVNDSEFDVGRSDSFCVAGYISDKANQKRCLAIILESKTSNFYHKCPSTPCCLMVCHRTKWIF